jgi:hypothetical protein
MPRFHRIDGVRVPFTAEEEIARDAEEAQVAIDMAVKEERILRVEILEAKLTDDSITFEEMKELMRLRG